jgi:hypothetical protein
MPDRNSIRIMHLSLGVNLFRSNFLTSSGSIARGNVRQLFEVVGFANFLFFIHLARMFSFIVPPFSRFFA